MPSVKLAVDWFRVRKTIHQIHRLSELQSPVSILSTESSTGIYSPIGVIDTTDFGLLFPFPAEQPFDRDDDDNEDENNYICKTNAN